MNERYILAIGKFGMYFYDSERKKDLTLKDVLCKLNLLEVLEKARDDEE